MLLLRVALGLASQHVWPRYEHLSEHYLADRKGWSLPADRYEPSFLQDYAAQGARYFVSYDPSLVPAGSAIADWLDTEASQVRSAAVNGCDIWALRPGGSG